VLEWRAVKYGGLENLVGELADEAVKKV